MKKINKETLLNIYSKLSIVVGLGVFLILIMYFDKFPELMHGVIDKGIFNLNFGDAYELNDKIFNFPLVWFIGFFLFNLGVLIYSQTGKKVEANFSSASIFYNTILSFLLIIVQLVFYYMIPETVNGVIDIGLFTYEFNILTTSVNSGINFAYILAIIYTFFNMFVVYYVMRNDDVEFDGK